MANITVNELLEAGVHFGHQTKRWNPKMKKYIFAARNGIHIVDLNKTLTQIQIACGFLHEIVLNGGSVLFVSHPRPATARDVLESVRLAVGKRGVVLRVPQPVTALRC